MLSSDFLKYSSFELPERVGCALRDGAMRAPISFGSAILPRVDMTNGGEGAGFHFSVGLGFPEGTAADDPRVPDDFRAYHTATRQPMTATGRALDAAGAMWGGNWGGHSNPDFGRIVNLGTNGIRREIDRCEALHPEAHAFYNGCRCAMDALDVLGGRFRALAGELAQTCPDPADRARYLAAEKAFSVIPMEPAYDFESACHAFYLTYTFDGVDSPGRFDQYMRRAYEVEQDRASRDDALSRLWDAFHEVRAWNLCLSGSDCGWRDETNALTYAILRLAAEKRYQTPNITLRVHRNTPDALWQAVSDTLATGIGMPALYNDEVVCPALEKLGIPARDSHEYCMNGCNQIDIMAKSHMGLEDGEVNLGKCLEYALHGGVNTLNGRLEGLPTGDAREFASYEEVENAFFRQMEYMAFQACLHANMAQQERAAFSPNPFRSCLIEGCLEKARDYRDGGPLYGHGQILLEAIADAGDSLWAVKKLVFEEKKYTMRQLVDALDADFEGYPELFRDFSSAEKFGNDLDCVDGVTARAVEYLFSFLNRQRTYRGGVYSGGCSPFNRAAGYGRKIGALPNGHRKADPLIADSIGATPGRDEKGPTALMKSVLKLPHRGAGSGFILNVKFDKKIFRTEKGKLAFTYLAKAYFAAGGQQCTATVVSPDELLDAMKNPDAHRDLIVRVGGYSDYFVNLEEALRENVIRRSILGL